MTRILHIIGTLNPEAGGPTEAVRVLLGFGPIGYVGEVVTLDPPGAPFLEQFPFPIHALGPIHSVYGYTPKLLPWLMQNGDRFDGVVVNGLWQYCGFAAWRAFAGKKPYVVFTHGMLDPYFKRQFPRKHIKKWMYWLVAEYWILRSAFRVLFTSPAEEALARQSFWLHRWNGFVVPYGASGPPSDSNLVRDRLLEHMPRLSGQRYILYLGRIHRKKGCDLLIHAFAQIAAQDPGLHLVMAGPDQQGWAASLHTIVSKAGLSERIHWPGMLQGEAKWAAFLNAEAFILPSHQENFGIAVAEALGCGIPVLLSDKVNIAEQIASDGAGYMESDTLEGTRRLLLHWLATPPDARSQMRDNALVCFHHRYDMRENAKTIIRLFQNSRPGGKGPSTIPPNP